MKYDTLIIGSGYAALGYATVRGSTLICEEREFCDTAFCLPLSGFGRWEYEPVTEQGRALRAYFESMGLVRDGYPNVNALECGFCGFALKHGVEILLKCRVLSDVQGDDGIHDVSVINGAGIEHIFADRVIDMRPSGEMRSLTFLFTTREPERDLPRIEEAFPEAFIEPAFYEGRYALHVPTQDVDHISAKSKVYDRWSAADHGAQLLYTAPALAVRSCVKREVPADSDHGEPIAAFECGMAYAKKLGGLRG